MSDGAKPPQGQPPGQQRTTSGTATPAQRTASATGIPAQRTASGTGIPRVSSTSNPRVMTAARTEPLPKEPEAPLGKRLQSEASNLGLNLVSMAKDALEDFRRRDRFFKYKAFIVAGWFALSATTLGIACPQGGLAVGEMGARVVVGTTPGRPSLVIYNESDETWKDVRFTVNKEFGAYVAKVDPKSYVTLTPKQLLRPNGQPAPSDLVMRDLEIKTEDGSGMLLKDGQVP